MELYILRHGTTEWNKNAKLQGSTDIPLDPDGEALAFETQKGLLGVHIDKVYSSPLKRAMETCRIVLGDRKLPIIRDRRLQEVNFGIWEGRDCSSGSDELPPKMIDDFFDLKAKTALVPPNGESLQDVLRRTQQFLEEILADPANENLRILISTHGAAGRALMHFFWKDDDFWHGCVPPNCSVQIVTLRNGKVTEIKKDCIFYQQETKDYYEDF